MKMKSEVAGRVSVPPEVEQRTSIASSRSSPRTRTTLEFSSTAMFGVSPIWSMRYWDIVAASEGPRTSMTTRLANRAKFMPPGRRVRPADDVDVLVLAREGLVVPPRITPPP
jgi:hypothetical protein